MEDPMKSGRKSQVKSPSQEPEVCLECGTSMRESTEAHKFTVTRKWAITIADAKVFSCPKCGEREVAIHKADALERTIATELLKKPTLLCGDEVTFLRNCLAMKGRQLAKELGIKHETLSRYETSFCPMNPTVDRLIRAMVALWYLEHGGETFTAETAASIASPTGEAKPLKLTVYFDPQGIWRKAAA
jgi:putative zinc finger/helix-turn-helix YgiT family protein